MEHREQTLYLIATNNDGNVIDHKNFRIEKLEEIQKEDGNTLSIKVDQSMELDFIYSKFRNNYKKMGIAVIEINNDRLISITTADKFSLEFETVKHNSITIGYKCIGITLKNFRKTLLNLKLVNEEQLLHKIKDCFFFQ